MNEPALASEPSRLVRCGPPAAKIVPSSASDGQAQLLGEVVTGRAPEPSVRLIHTSPRLT